LWPSYLITRFDQVIAFEPEPRNFMCASLNLVHHQDIQLLPFALGASTGVVQLELSEESDGMHYVTNRAPQNAVSVPLMPIDALELAECDAIFLDCEGYDLEALKGAAKTIERCKPTLVVEENSLIQRYGRKRGDVERYLKTFGYALVAEHCMVKPVAGEFHGSDLIFTCTPV
jgi:FkbM family methyltransferase